MMNDIGRLCVKIAGRDSNKVCVIVDVVDDHTVLIDGQTRRRNCNVIHLEPLPKLIEIKKGASSSEIKAAFLKIGLDARETKPKKADSRVKRVKSNKQSGKEPSEKKAKKEKAPKKEKKAPVKKHHTEASSTSDKSAKSKKKE
jgi:large subunit ribosomal protein L14e